MVVVVSLTYESIEYSRISSVGCKHVAIKWQSSGNQVAIKWQSSGNQAEEHAYIAMGMF